VQVRVIAATADQAPILANLIELYAYDFSEIADLQLNADGRFGYALLPLYWQEPNRYPFLVTVDDTLAGFALVKQGSVVSGQAEIWDMAEFFIVRGQRKQGVGTRVAHEMWRKFPGRWEIRVTERNQAGQAFWARAIASFMGRPITASIKRINHKLWHIFSFDTQLARSARPSSKQTP
jgi:predicted acetyltransferase